MNRDEILLIIDKSGSMETIKDDTIGGFNDFLPELEKIDCDASVTFVLFHDHYRLASLHKRPWDKNGRR